MSCEPMLDVALDLPDRREGKVRVSFRLPDDEAGARRLVLYHHAPSHGDDQMDRIAAEYLAKGARRNIEVLTSFEGMTLPVGPEAA